MQIGFIYAACNLLVFYVTIYLGGFLYSLFAATHAERAWWILAGPIWLAMLVLAIVMFFILLDMLEQLFKNTTRVSTMDVEVTIFNACIGLWFGRLKDPLYTDGILPWQWDIGFAAVLPLTAIFLTAFVIYRLFDSPDWQRA